jgi:hypothetical protein
MYIDMIKLIKFIFYVALLAAVFFTGVKYSEKTREMADWLFEAKEQEIDIKEIKKDIKNNYDEEIIIEESNKDVAPIDVNNVAPIDVNNVEPLDTNNEVIEDGEALPSEVATPNETLTNE